MLLLVHRQASPCCNVCTTGTYLQFCQLDVCLQVVANGLQSISSHRAWDGGSRQQVTLQELRAGQQASGTQLLLLSGLLNELGSPSLQEGATPVVLHAAAQEASSLPSSLAPSALAKILTATVRYSSNRFHQVQVSFRQLQCVSWSVSSCFSSSSGTSCLIHGKSESSDSKGS